MEGRVSAFVAVFSGVLAVVVLCAVVVSVDSLWWLVREVREWWARM